jgi:hypothetical protein
MGFLRGAEAPGLEEDFAEPRVIHGHGEPEPAVAEVHVFDMRDAGRQQRGQPQPQAA